MSFLKQIKYKDKSGKVIPMSIKVNAANVQEDSEHRFITDTDKNNFTAKMNTNGNASNTTATFTAASTRANITSNEKLSVIFGKIAKYFTDLKAVAFTGSYSDLSNKPTIPTVPGSLKNPYALKLNGKTYDGSVATDAGTMGIAYGGTGATTAANARTNLGLGASATQAVANNLTTTAAGSVLDARQGKVLNDNIAQINGNIDNLNGSLGTTNNNVAQLQQNIANVMPGSTYIDIPNPYTAVRDGWAFLTVTGTNEGHAGLICSNGFSYTQPYLKKDAVVHMYIPVRKGQTVSFNGLNFTPNVFRFY